MSTALTPERKRTPLARLAAGLRQCAEALEEMEGPVGNTPMTAPQVAQALGVSAAEIYRQVRLGNIGSIRLGRKAVRIPVEEFEAFRKRRTR